MPEHVMFLWYKQGKSKKYPEVQLTAKKGEASTELNTYAQDSRAALSQDFRLPNRFMVTAMHEQCSHQEEEDPL